MMLKTKLTEKEYIKASFLIVFARKSLRYFLGVIGIIFLINAISGIASGKAIIPVLLPPVIIFGIYLVIFYFSIKKGYSNNKRISENIEYTFGQNDLLIAGESFKTELSWNKIYKVTKTKDWLLIWQTKNIANAIPKKDILEEELTKLKIILSNNHVTNNL